MPKRCYFSTDISEALSCSRDGRFDDDGLPISNCKEFPCEYYQRISREIEENIQRYGVSNIELFVIDGH